MDRAGDPVGNTNNAQYKMKLHLTLDGTKHIYNPKYRTFHITLQHLYGEQAHVSELQQMGDLPIELHNRETGNTVLFEWLGIGPVCNLYHALYAHDIHAPAIKYYLMVWADMETLRVRYSADLDLHGMWCKSPELNTSSALPPIPAL